MIDMLRESVYFGVTVSIAAYIIGCLIRKKINHPLVNPLLIAIIITILIVLGCNIDYNTYYEGAKYLNYLLTPATVALAIPLYEKLELLKKNYKAVLAGILSGVLTSALAILATACLFGLTHEEYVTFLPKSITTAIGMDLSAELGGYVTITVAVIVITGIFGNIIAETVFKVFRISEPIAKGIALGTSAHAMGTSKAMELGETEGAMSGLSIAVAGIITVVVASIFAQIM